MISDVNHKYYMSLIYNKQNPPQNHYVYMYIRDKDSKRSDKGLAGTPYYVGKGVKTRAWIKRNRVKLPNDEHIVIIADNLSHEEALLLEIATIAKWGRLDLQTGILMNLTEGGEGVIGTSNEVKEKRRASQRDTWATPEARANKSKAAKLVWSDPEYKKERCKRAKERQSDPEYRKRQSKIIRESWSNPKLRAEQSIRTANYFKSLTDEEKETFKDKIKIATNTVEYKEKQSQAQKEKYNKPGAREKASHASKTKWAKVTPEQMSEIVEKRRVNRKLKRESKNTLP